MHITWRLWLRVSLVVVAVIVIWLRFVPHRTKTVRPIKDLAATSPLNQPGGGLVSTDAYAVYSALYQTPMREPLAFAQNSVTDIPQVNGNCLRPSTPQEHEMADAFVAANQQSHQWEHRFSIPQGYRLLAPTDLNRAQTCLATHKQDTVGCENDRQLRYVRYLGVPGFDHTHTHALVSVIKSCGGLCGSGGIFAVEKIGDTWRRSATTDFIRDCSWMY